MITRHAKDQSMQSVLSFQGHMFLLYMLVSRALISHTSAVLMSYAAQDRKSTYAANCPTPPALNYPSAKR